MKRTMKEYFPFEKKTVYVRFEPKTFAVLSVFVTSGVSVQNTQIILNSLRIEPTIYHFKFIQFCDQNYSREKILVPDCNTLAYGKCKKQSG